MSNYNQKYNKDDVFIRDMIVSLLGELNKKIYYYNRLNNKKVEKINVPCMYSITGGERFLRDEFFYDALEQGVAVGDYEKVPRCIINLNGINVNTTEQTNKYNRTKIVREVNHKLRTLYLNVDYIPITLNFDCKIICSNNIELFKITECIISKIYKNNNFFKVDFGMFNVDSSFMVPENYNHERPQEFGLNDKKEFSMTLDIEMKSFIPAFENGLLMCEIDEMLQKLPNDASGIVQFRPNEYGEMQMLTGGVIETFRVSEYYNHMEEPTLKSNTHKSPIVVDKHNTLDKKDYEENLIDRKYITKQ